METLQRTMDHCHLDEAWRLPPMYWELTRAPSPRIPTATCCCSKTALQISAEAFTAPKPGGKNSKTPKAF